MNAVWEEQKMLLINWVGTPNPSHPPNIFRRVLILSYEATFQTISIFLPESPLQHHPPGSVNPLLTLA